MPSSFPSIKILGFAKQFTVLNQHKPLIVVPRDYKVNEYRDRNALMFL